jgi:Ca2+-binding EF-hand superfamily protein
MSGFESNMPDIRSVPPQQLELYLQRLFKIGDKDGNGVLDSVEFRELLTKSGFELDGPTITKIMEAADTNHDGVIQYEEFLPAMKALIGDLTNNTAEPMPHLHSVPPIEMEAYLRRLFQIGDRNNDGVLQPGEYEALLKKSGFNFDTPTIAQIMQISDTNQDGVISYEEFIPAIIHICAAAALPPPGVKAHSRGFSKGSGQQHPKMAPAQSFKGTKQVDPRAPKKEGMPDFKDVPAQQLELYMQRLFKIGDKDGNGVLDAQEFRELLRKSGFGLDRDTIDKIMVAADTNHDGVIQYEEFVPAVRAMINNIGGLANMPSEFAEQPHRRDMHPDAVPSPYYGGHPGFHPGHGHPGIYGSHYDGHSYGAYGNPGYGSGGYGHHPGVAYGHPGASGVYQGTPYGDGSRGPQAGSSGGAGGSASWAR